MTFDFEKIKSSVRWLMAIYHLHCDIIGRSAGRSAVAAAAYRATCAIEDRTTGEKFDYSRKEKALFEHIYCRAEKDDIGVTVAQVPDWARNRSELWNRVEEKENRKNSQFCRSFDIALMKELSFEDNKKLIEKWINRNFCSRGFVADVVIHAPHKNKDGKTNENLHTHILIPTRKIDLNGWGEKDREANSKEFLQKIRKSWADIVNAKFKELGMSERIDERTLEEQGIDREPQQHQGVTATAIERKGGQARRKKYKSQEISVKEKVVEISDEKVDKELKNDKDFLKLNELLKKAKEVEKIPKEFREELKKWGDRIKSMTPSQWQDFIRNYDKDGLTDFAYGEFHKSTEKAWTQSQNMWVEKNIEPLTKYFADERNKKVKAYNQFVETNKQPPIEPTVYGIFGGKYQTSDGEKFGDNIIQARIHQQEIRANFDAKFKPLEMDADIAIAEHKACKEKKYNEVREIIGRHHPNLAQKMIEGAKKIYQESPVFYPVRAMVSAFQHFKDVKNTELAEWKKEQSRNRKPTRNNDIGFSMSD